MYSLATRPLRWAPSSLCVETLLCQGEGRRRPRKKAESYWWHEPQAVCDVNFLGAFFVRIDGSRMAGAGAGWGSPGMADLLELF